MLSSYWPTTFFSSHDQIRKWLWRSLPPPKALRTETVGIDLSEQTVKYVALRLEKGSPCVWVWGKRSCGDALISGTTIGNPDALVAHLRKIFLRTGRAEARVSLGEEAGYLFRVAIAPARSFEELRAQVEFQLAENIPLGPGEVVFDAVPAVRLEDTVLVDVAAYPKKIIEELTDLFARAGMRLISLEIEGSAIARSVIPLGEKGAFFLADIGQTEAAVYVVENGHLLFSAKLPVGGAHFTEALRAALGSANDEEIEDLKHTTNFFVDSTEESLPPAARAAREVADQLVEAMRRHIVYWQEHTPTGGYAHAPLQSVIMVGGTVRMPGFAAYVSRALRMPVEIGNVWSNFPPTRKVIPPIPQTESVQYATAIGLALRDVLPALAPVSQWM
ncbi:MAG: hypothetical protein KatS3mg099_270 [Candidatus Parcubacteria bacterium]|nr:MAG: hypothetical protein KatS3mg099_270 [Candidatus Parcubacteria bacterium]